MPKIKEIYEWIVYSNKVYNTVFKPFDKILFPIVNWQDLKKERQENPVPLNKIPNVADLSNPEWVSILEDMKDIFHMDENHFHRKIWEFTHIIYSLRKLGHLHPENTGIAIGAGREQILYYLAYKVRKIVGIDLYEGNYLGCEDEPDIPENPQKYAPFHYPENHLELKQMDALDLKYPDNTFDFVLSASSIEHFGTLEEIERSIQEMNRVLKPGGACVVTSEIKLNRLCGGVPHTRIFDIREFIDLFTRNGFEMNENELDVKIEDHFFNNWVKCPQEVFKLPHVILRFLRSVFTSLSLAFVKPGDEVKKGDWKQDVAFKPFKYDSELEVSPAAVSVKQGQSLPLNLNIKNMSSFHWYTHGMSHRIAVGVKLLDEEGAELDGGFGEIIIPEEIPVGKSFEFSAQLSINLKPGKYQLYFDLKKELVTWFNEKGQTPAIVPLEVL